jgi:hypothetical protein
MAGLLLLAVAFGGTPARAQIMHDDGITLPWFHSRADRMARQACEDELPECRDSVRRELVTEKLITTIAPWVLLLLVIIGAIRYVRYQERKRDAQRHDAARHQRAAKVAKASRGADDAPVRQSDADDDGLGFGHPGDRH